MPRFFFFFFNHTRVQVTLGVSVNLLANCPEQAIPVRSSSRSMATLNSASAVRASSSSLLVRMVLLLVRVELLPDPKPALLLLLLTIDWELWRHPCWPTSNFDASYGVFFQRVIRE